MGSRDQYSLLRNTNALQIWHQCFFCDTQNSVMTSEALSRQLPHPASRRKLAFLSRSLSTCCLRLLSPRLWGLERAARGSETP